MVGVEHLKVVLTIIQYEFILLVVTKEVVRKEGGKGVGRLKVEGEDGKWRCQQLQNFDLILFLAPTGALIVTVVYYSIYNVRSHFLRFRAFLPIYLVFLFVN